MQERNAGGRNGWIPERSVLEEGEEEGIHTRGGVWDEGREWITREEREERNMR